MHESIPDFYFNRITDISVEFLKNHNIKAIGIDLDNTTVYDLTFIPLQGAKDWLNKVQNAGIKVIIITNTFTLRAFVLSKQFGLPCFSMSKKPNPDNILKAVDLFKVKKEEFAMIGDRLFGDVTAGNRAGVISIKVDPFMKEILFARKAKKRRIKEAFFIEEYKNDYPKMKGFYDEY